MDRRPPGGLPGGPPSAAAEGGPSAPGPGAGNPGPGRIDCGTEHPPAGGPATTDRFAHLHVHTEYSLLDGLSNIGLLVDRAAELGMDALAITDHGGLYGAIEFYKAATKRGVRPIIGCEVYVAPGDRRSREPGDKRPFHMTVLARNRDGYRNLVRLVTRAHLEGYYYRPRLDREVLAEHAEGLIVLSGCPSSEVSRALSEGRDEDAREAASWYRGTFEHYHLELMRHGGVPRLEEINEGLIALSKDLDIPLVATNDSHYVDRSDAELQDILVCIHTNTNVNDERRMRMEEDSYYLKSPEEMYELFPDVPEAVASTVRIAELCDLELSFDTPRLPRFPSPAGRSADEHLRELCLAGLARRLPGAGEAERARLESELEVIRVTQFPDYFLVVWDIARFVRERGILLAVRGSAAASLVLFCLDVTDINPLEFDLVFERFLNVERKEMPDIDMDFQDDRRDEVIEYVVGRYGRDHVAQIITFGTLGARAAIRDSGRALAMTYGEVDAVARLVPQRLNISIDEALETSPELSAARARSGDVARLIETAQGLEGVVRHSSTHAAGVVISSEPLGEYVPLQRPIKGTEGGVNTTQYPMEPLADLGLLKMDFLGLANLTILARTLALIQQRSGQRIELAGIPLDDEATFELLSRGETVGVFQLEGDGMTRHIQKLRPSSLGDVAAMIALYRPGPMEHIDTFIAAKHGRAAPEYPHPDLEEILRETYGVIVFQDQVLHIARRFAGYSLGEADIVRKAMGKKVPEIMAEERERFIEGALAQGYSRDVAQRVFELVEPFAGYAFNKAHSVSYGLISYWTAYLKANHPGEYMVSLLNAYSGNYDKIAAAVGECARLEIPVLGPDVAEGEVEFSLAGGADGREAIRFGMASVKNVGAAAVEPIVAARREHGPFGSIEEMCRAADLSGLNRKMLESLVRAGALDRYGDRTSILSVCGRIVSLAQSEAELRGSAQTTMFDMFGESVEAPLVSIELEVGTTSAWQMGSWEQELLGVDLSSVGSERALAQAVDPATILSRGEIGPGRAGEEVALAGRIEGVTNRLTRSGRPFTIATLRMLGGEIEIFVWEELQRDTADVWVQGKLVRAVGTVRDRGDDRVSISAISAEECAVPGPSEPQPATQPIAALDQQAVERTGTDPAGLGAPANEAADDPDPGPVEPEAPADEILAASDAAPPTNGAVASPGPARPPRRITVTLVESAEPERDVELLRQLVLRLTECSGSDEVGMLIESAGRTFPLDWPSLRVDATDDLIAEISALIGERGRASVAG